VPCFFDTIDALPTRWNNATTPEVTPGSRKDAASRGREQDHSRMQRVNQMTKCTQSLAIRKPTKLYPDFRFFSMPLGYGLRT
jgi:hypothetical protein